MIVMVATKRRWNVYDKADNNDDLIYYLVVHSDLNQSWRISSILRFGPSTTLSLVHTSDITT